MHDIKANIGTEQTYYTVVLFLNWEGQTDEEKKDENSVLLFVVQVFLQSSPKSSREFKQIQFDTIRQKHVQLPSLCRKEPAQDVKSSQEFDIFAIHMF